MIDVIHGIFLNAARSYAGIAICSFCLIFTSGCAISFTDECIFDSDNPEKMVKMVSSVGVTVFTMAAMAFGWALIQFCRILNI